MSYARALILPLLNKYLVALLALNLVVVCVNIALKEQNCGALSKTIASAIEIGAFHCLFEGLAIFLMRYGAGAAAFRASLWWGVAWGCITTVVFYFIINQTCSQNKSSYSDRLVYLLFLCYSTVLFLFYACLVFLPLSILYRRPSLILFSGLNCLYHLFWILAGSVVYFDTQQATVCTFSVFAIFLMVFVQPPVIYFALQKDSQYWCGLLIEEGNPLADVWGQISADTATMIVKSATDLESGNEKVAPLLHFGLLQINQGMGFVSGGYSRIYFGKLRGKEDVAIKIIYAIELSPKEIAALCAEARVLHALRHENVVVCKGVCVMPPVISLVFEYCIHGSLFNFLYKPLELDEMTASNINNNNNNNTLASSLLDAFRSSFQSSSNALSASDAMRSSESAGRSSRSSKWIDPVFRGSESVLRLEDMIIHTTTTTNVNTNSNNNNFEQAPSSRPSSFSSMRFSFVSSSSTPQQVVASPMISSAMNAIGGGGEGASAAGGGGDGVELSSSNPKVPHVSQSNNTHTNTTTSNNNNNNNNNNSAGVPQQQTLASLLSLKQRLFMMRDCCSAIAFVHSKDYMVNTHTHTHSYAYTHTHTLTHTRTHTHSRT